MEGLIIDGGGEEQADSESSADNTNADPAESADQEPKSTEHPSTDWSDFRDANFM